MWQRLSRLLLAMWFVGMVMMAVRGTPARGQADEGDLLKQFLPSLMGNSPAQVNPPLQNYVALGTFGDDGDSEIYTLRADSSETIRLTENTVRDYTPQFSPDGSQIVFLQVQNEGTPMQIRVMSIRCDGSGLHSLLEETFEDVNFQWSPDGKWIGVVGRLSTSASTFTLLKVAVNGMEPVTFVADQIDPAMWGWSPDGMYLHYGRYENGTTAAWVVPISLEAPVKVSTNAYQVAWHPGGDALFIREFNGAYLGYVGTIATADGSTHRQLYRGNFSFEGWLLQGRVLLLRVEGDNLATIDYAGGEVEAMTTYKDGVYFRGIAPDGSAVLYSPQNLGGEIPFYLHAVEGKAQVLMECNEYCSLTSGSWALDGSGILLSFYLPDRIGFIGVVFIPLGEVPGTPISQTLDVWGWKAYFLPFSDRYGVMEHTSSGYPPPNSKVPYLFDTELVTETRMPFHLKEIEWRYLP